MGIFRRLRCPHSNLMGIYGDLINHHGGRRLRCLSCGSTLDGPVILAEIRKKEIGEKLMAIRTKKYVSNEGSGEVRAVKITEKNLEDIVEYILRNGGAASGRLNRPAFKRPARIRIKQWTYGETWSKKDWRVALVGDWIVRYEDGTFARIKAIDFPLTFEPIN